jgi:DNA polymerase-3 subunit beta
VAQVAFAVGRDDTLPVLTGIRVEFEGDRLVLAATDRYRLAVRELNWSPGVTDLSTIALVQGRSLADTARALADADSVTIALSGSGSGEGLIGFEGSAGGESRRTTNRLLDGEFPKYRSLLPSESTSTAVIESASFLETVKRVALVADRNTPVRLTFDDGQTIVEAGTGDEAQAVETLSCAFTGDPLTIAFNPQFLQEGIAALGAEFTEVSFTTATKPAVIAGRSDADVASDGSYRYLIMPVRLSG